MTKKIPATVITGFLGAGKTSMIQHLLTNAGGRRIALIINEFGDRGVDGEILTGCGFSNCSEDDVIELSNGCICCTVADDFLPTIQKILERPEAPDHIVIETSGLALPKPLVKAFNWPQVRTRVTVDGVVTVVDVPAVVADRFASDPGSVQAQRESDTALDHESPLEELFEEQLGCADLVVLNKTDLVSVADLAAVRTRVADKIRSSVRMITARYGVVNVTALLGLNAAAEDDLDARPSHLDLEGEHDHDDFTSMQIELPEITAVNPLIARIEVAMNTHDILRIKGFVAVVGKNMRLLVQAVGGRVQQYYDREWREHEKPTSWLIVITVAGADQEAIRNLLIG